MKKEYIRPLVYDIELEDIITTSGGLQGDSGMQDKDEGSWSIGDF